MKKILVTGAAGFIGFHLTMKLIENGYEVVGLDNMNNYYNDKLKYAKLPILGIKDSKIEDNLVYMSSKYPRFKFVKIDIRDRNTVEKLFAIEKFDIVCNLAAQAGVQYSIENPHTYIDNNITGFVNIIEAARQNNVEHFIYASSSSVYGNREDVPFRESDRVDNPISLYAATKKANELIAHSYSHLNNLKTTGLRFFTVYGPWGRPDMAPYIFVEKILNDKPITVFNNGNLERDFTYVDDVVKGVFLILEKGDTNLIYDIYNIGNSKPVNLIDFIATIEKILEKKAIIQYLPLRPGDVQKTYSSIDKMRINFDYEPKFDHFEGLFEFIKYFKTVILKSNKIL